MKIRTEIILPNGEIKKNIIETNDIEETLRALMAQYPNASIGYVRVDIPVR